MNLLLNLNKSVIAGSALAVCMAATPMANAGSGSDYSGALNDAWLDGKVETAFALNSHLNPFSIDTDVQDGAVILEGTVESDIDKDLAGEIAKSVEGVTSVDNRLKVAKSEPGTFEKASDDFLQHVSDATTTAKVKSKLLANDHTEGLKINVDTTDATVTLTGTVESDEVRELAEALAQNTESVKSVENRLEIVEKHDS